MQIKEEKREKINIFHSISAYICELVFAIIILTMIGLLACMIPRTRQISTDTNGKYFLSLAEVSAQTLDEMQKEGNDENTADAKFLAGVQIEHVPSAYVYLVDTDGTMLYHPTADKIGKPVENSVVADVVEQLKAGKVPANDVVFYDYNGSRKYAAYALTADNRIVVLSADQSDVLGVYNDMYIAVFRVALISLVFCMCLGFLVSRAICKPIRQLTEVITQTANLDFRTNPAAQKLRKKKDETGIMARAIHNMRKSLRDMVANIEEASEQLTASINH